MKPTCLAAIRCFGLALAAAALPVSAALAGTVERSIGAGTITTSRGGSGTITYTTSITEGSTPGCSGTFTSDDFTEAGTSTIPLSSHSSNEGDAWLGDASDGEVVVDRTADELRSTNTTGDTKTVYLDIAPACADYSVFGSGKTGSTGSSQRLGLRGRWSDDGGGSDGYAARIAGDGSVLLEVYVNGTATTLDTDTVASFSASTYYSMELRLTGTSIEFYVNDVLEASATNSAVTSAGSVGALLRNNNPRLTSISGAYL